MCVCGARTCVCGARACVRVRLCACVCVCVCVRTVHKKGFSSPLTKYRTPGGAVIDFLSLLQCPKLLSAWLWPLPIARYHDGLSWYTISVKLNPLRLRKQLKTHFWPFVGMLRLQTSPRTTRQIDAQPSLSPATSQHVSPCSAVTVHCVKISPFAIKF